MEEPRTTPNESLKIKQDKDNENTGTNPNLDDNLISIDIEQIKAEAQKLLSPNPKNNGKKQLSDFDHLRITDLTEIPEPEPVLTINNEIIAAIEDIFTISGPPKSGKSSVQNMLIAKSVSPTGDVDDGFEGVEIRTNDKCQAVLHFDTEQARHKHQKNVRSIIKRARLSTTPSYYCTYNIRQLDIGDYPKVTAEICELAFNRFGGIHSIWIDGAADYIADVNDQAESNKAIKFFEELAIKYHTAVFLIVHTNPGSEKERGHFGSQCQRKSGGILSVKVEGDYSVIEPKMLRYAGKGDIPQLKFKYDKDKGYHVGCEQVGLNPDAKAENKMRENWKLCEKIFSGQKSFNREKTISLIMIKKACQIRTASGVFALMNASEMIIKGDDDNYRVNPLYDN